MDAGGNIRDREVAPTPDSQDREVAPTPDSQDREVAPTPDSQDREASPDGQHSLARQVRRNYFVVSVSPLLVYFLLALVGAMITRAYLTDLIEGSTYELNADAKRSLQQLGEAVIRTKARDVARQLEVYLSTHPGMSIEQLREDPLFMDLAVQTVGKTGYTALSEAADSYRIRVHPNAALNDEDMRSMAERMPSWWKIVEQGISGREASGYYDWVERDGRVRQKFLVTTPVGVPVDGITLMASATTYIDEFSAPVAAMSARAEGIVEQYRQYLSQQWLAVGLVFAGVLAITVAGTYVLGSRSARRFIDPIGQLAAAARELGAGRWGLSGLGDVTLRKDEIGTLARALQRMSSQLQDLFSRLELRVEELNATRQALEESEDHYKRLYEQSKSAEEVYRSLIHSSADAIVLLDLELRVKYLSPRFTRIFGWTEEELLGEFIPYVPDSELTATTDILLDVVENGTLCHGYETRRTTRGGALLDVSISASRYDDHQGNPAGVLAILRDISESKRIESQMQRIDRLKAIGTLAGGIAHDFNNLLMAIQGNVSILKTEMADSRRSVERLVNIEEQIHSGSSLTNQLLGYARKGRYEFKVADLNEAVLKTAEAIHRTRKDVTFRYDLAPDLAPVEADFYQIEQVLMNLYINACDAMPDGGEITIHTANLPPDQVPATLPPASAGVVLLSIGDTGAGMDHQTLDRIFDPFFTTKEMGRGTGLGLASAYGIIAGHGGGIDVASKEGEGTTFHVYLPSTDLPLAPPVDDVDEVSTGKGTVLFVDDEAMVLEVGAEMVRSLGYTVITAGSGSEALDKYRSEGANIDVVILDMIMPGMSGSQVFDRLQELDPGVSVVVSTGYSIDGKTAEILTRGCRGFLQKPYTLAQLSERIRVALRAAA